MRWFDYPIGVPFGNANYDTGLGGSHDMTILAPPNMAVTSLVAGIVSNIASPTWGKQVGILLDKPVGDVKWFHYLHLSAVDPHIYVGRHIAVGDLIGWVGGGNTQADYKGTTNPTGQNFLNTPEMSSRIQVGLALMRGPAYGGPGWQNFPPIDDTLNPTPILEAARKEASMQHVYPGATVWPSPAAWTTRNGCESWPLTLVLHATQAGGGTGRDVAYDFWHSSQKCTHFVIDKDGTVYQHADPLIQAAAGNGTCTSTSGYWNTATNGNWYTVSIELFKIDNGEIPTEAQYRVLGELSTWICDLCHIPKKWCDSKDGGITSHGFFDPVHRSNVNGPGGDPGTFDWERYFHALQQQGGPDVFSNDLCIAVWESYFKSIGKPAPPRETGIFRSWRTLWMSGHFKGCCLSGEYNVTLPNGHAGVAQNYSGGTCVWDNATSIPTWL